MLLILVDELRKLTLIQNTKIKKIEEWIPGHKKYITIPTFDKLTKEHFVERIKQVNLTSKNDIGDFIKATLWYLMKN